MPSRTSPKRRGPKGPTQYQKLFKECLAAARASLKESKVASKSARLESVEHRRSGTAKKKEAYALHRRATQLRSASRDTKKAGNAAYAASKSECYRAKAVNKAFTKASKARRSPRSPRRKLSPSAAKSRRNELARVRRLQKKLALLSSPEVRRYHARKARKASKVRRSPRSGSPKRTAYQRHVKAYMRLHKGERQAKDLMRAAAAEWRASKSASRFLS